MPSSGLQGTAKKYDACAWKAALPDAGVDAQILSGFGAFGNGHLDGRARAAQRTRRNTNSVVARRKTDAVFTFVVSERVQMMARRDARRAQSERV
jgi:hypothetical protein